MAQGLSNGCAGLLLLPCVFSCFFYMRYQALTLHNIGTSQKKAKTDNLLGRKFRSSHQNMIHHLCQWQEPVHQEAGARRPRTSALPKRRWMDRKSGKCTGSSTYSFTLRSSGFRKMSSASLSSLLYPPNQWIEIPSGLHAIAVAMGHVRYGQGTSTSCTYQGTHGKHRIGTTRGTLAHRIAEGMHTGKSSPTGPINEGP